MAKLIEIIVQIKTDIATFLTLSQNKYGFCCCPYPCKP